MSEMLNQYEADRLGTGQDDTAGTGDGWPALPDSMQALPDFPKEALPPDFGAFVQAVSECWQVPPDMAACFALGVASAAVVGRVTVQPKARENDYREAAQLFLICQGSSGERKTHCLRYLAQPLEELLESRRQHAKEENARLERQLKDLEQSIRQAKDGEEKLTLSKQRDALVNMRVPEPESIQADVTPESVVLGMTEHDGRAVVLADEADFLNVLSGRSYAREGSAVNLNAILFGYNNSPHHGRRVNRSEWHIPQASLSICLGCQPGILEDFMADRTGADRGLHARFLYFLPKSMIGFRKADGRPVLPALVNWWVATVGRLAACQNLVLPFSSEAEEKYRVWFEDIEHRLLTDLSGPLQAWAGKLCGNTVRLAGLLALLAGKKQVVSEDWDNAQRIAEQYLIPHARAVFGGQDVRLSDEARKLLPRLRDLMSFSQADFWKESGRYILKNGDRQGYGNALTELAGLGYIRLAKVQPIYKGGRRPAPVWEVNPALRGQ